MRIYLNGGQFQVHANNCRRTRHIVIPVVENEYHVKEVDRAVTVNIVGWRCASRVRL